MTLSAGIAGLLTTVVCILVCPRAVFVSQPRLPASIPGSTHCSRISPAIAFLLPSYPIHLRYKQFNLFVQPAISLSHPGHYAPDQLLSANRHSGVVCIVEKWALSALPTAFSVTRTTMNMVGSFGVRIQPVTALQSESQLLTRMPAIEPLRFAIDIVALLGKPSVQRTPNASVKYLLCPRSPNRILFYQHSSTPHPHTTA